MYAKLVVGASAISSIKAMRDIGRLITSATPSTSLLSGFSQASSVIVDSTPAGWTYVGSVNANDASGIAAIGSSADTTGTFGYTIDTHYNLAFSAPCLSTGRLKYALLSIMWRGTSGNTSFALTAAESVTSAGVATNEGPRAYAASTRTIGETSGLGITSAAGAIIHVIATPQHITIINDARGLCAVWETSNTDVHDFYSKAPVVQYTHCLSQATARWGNIVPTNIATTQTMSWMDSVFGVTDVNTGTTYGTYDVTESAANSLGSLAQVASTYRNNSINAAGSPKYQVSPVFFQAGKLGYPVQFVTGPVSIYWTKPGLGTTGDEVDVNGDTYVFFDCGTGFGVIMKTS